jgi:hypothetical protein
MKLSFSHKIVCIFLCLIQVILYFSCTDSTPEIARVYYSLIYDFTDESLPPQVRMSVFIEALSDSRRIKDISLYLKDADYLWTIQNPLVIKDTDKQYFGHHDIVFPPNTEILEGRYEARFNDLAMREASAFFRIEKIPSLKELKTSSLNVSGFRSKKFAAECSVEQITVYDILANVLYTGKRTIEIDTDEKLLGMFPSAVSYRLFYKNQDNTTVIILPEVQLSEPQDDALEEEYDE